MLRIERKSDVGTLAVELPAATRVFIENGIDFCCAGQRSIDTACHASQIDPKQILEEITRSCLEQYAMQPANGSMEALVDFIMDRYLGPLRTKLSAIESLLDKTIYMHGVGLYGTREGVRAVFSNLSTYLWEHLQKKEDVIFPTILSGNGRSARHSFKEMRESHEKLSQHLDILHRLTAGFAATPTMCVAEKALMTSLQELATDVAAQFHMEHNILYPRALRE
jgi:regulator of cell morphogenesis and NO signaling